MMRYLALACDYDGTIADHGRVSDSTIRALECVQESGRKVILVTGRQMDDLGRVFTRMDLFDRIVAENGAVLYTPRSGQERCLAEPPDPKFLEALQRWEVEPLSVGKCIIATWQPQENAVLQAVKETGLELQVIFNKGAVMILPSGVNKSSGLKAALEELGLSPHNVVGVGDAENDHAFLNLCECSAAVANALDAVKERTDIVTGTDHGGGVEELIAELLENDLRDRDAQLQRHYILLGHDSEGNAVSIPPFGTTLLVAGPSGSGKSTTITAFLERVAKSQYQFAVVDPEGDYNDLELGVVLGSQTNPPTGDELIQLLDKSESTVVNLVGVDMADRPQLAAQLLQKMSEFRMRTGRPHWLILDEAHHLLPSSWHPAPAVFPAGFGASVLVTVHPEHVSPAALEGVDVVIAVGASPDATLAAFSEALEEPPPRRTDATLEGLEVMAWFRRQSANPIRVRVEPGEADRRRHKRKYAEGDLQERSFYFRGPAEKLNLRAQNLSLFLQIADGVDPETWLHHLRQGDYSQWVRSAIKDERLAEEIRNIERAGLSAEESRDRIKAAIQSIYTSSA
jgi:hydroxymethylpyrimidine pyrophosphatase-like HAD family hydrolase